MQFNDLTHKLVELGFIYALKHPITKEIFYIGATESSPKDRLASHYSAFKEYLKGVRNNNKRFEYFESLFPEFAEVETLKIVQNDYLYKIEIEYIEKYSKLYELTNQTIGGTGGDTFSLQSDDNKQIISKLMSEKNSKRIMSEEQKNNLSIARMGGNNPMAKTSTMPKSIIFKNDTPLKIVEYNYQITEFLNNELGKENHKIHSGRAGNISKALKKQNETRSSGFIFKRYEICSKHIQDIVQTLEKSND